MTTEINIDAAAEYFGEALPERITEELNKALVKSAMRGVQMIVSRIIPSRSPQPVDRGVYRAGWHWRKMATNTSSSISAFIENNEKHAQFIEYGVRAENVKVGRQMIDALTEWVIRKGIAEDADEARGIAFAIANNMKTRGIFNKFAEGNGLHILGELVEGPIQKIMKEEMARAAKKAIKNV